MPVADPALHAVARDDEIGAARHDLVVDDLGVEEELHAELEAAVGEDAQELLARDAGEAVAVRPQALAAIVDVDGGPVRERLGDRLVRGRVVLLEIRERLVREDDAPSEGHACGIAFDDRDVGVGSRLLVEEREVETGGAPADADDRTVRDVTRCEIASFHAGFPYHRLGRAPSLVASPNAYETQRSSRVIRIQRSAPDSLCLQDHSE